MAPRAKPYRFTELERWTRSQLRVLQTFMAYLPGSGLGADFKQQLRDALGKLTGTEVDIWLDSITPAKGADVLRMLPDPACLAVLRLEPTEHQVLLDLDLKMAGMAVEKMLGGSGDDADPARPLSSIETGLLSFVLLKLMHAAQQVLADEQQFALRLNKIHAHAGEVAPLINDKNHVVMGFKIFLDMQVGYARLIVPGEMITTHLAPPPERSGPFFERRLERLRQAMPRVASLRTQLVVEAGRSELSEEDFAGVEVGDILLVEQTGVRKDGESLTGEVEIRVGRGKHGVVRGSLCELEGGGMGVEITGIEAFPEPDPGGDDSGSADAANVEDAVQEESEEESEEAMKTPLRPGRGQLRHTSRTRAFGEQVQVRGAGGDALDELGEVAGEAGEHQSDYEEEEQQYEEEGAEAGEEAPAEEEQVGDNLGETEALLKDVAMPVVVELGRIRTTAGDIINLRPGQILELRRTPNDPVDITVNGKLVGKGELVEVEGELGVRLLSLTR